VREELDLFAFVFRLQLVRSPDTTFIRSLDRGCQMVYFHSENPNLGIFWMALIKRILVYSMVLWYILGSFGKFYVNLKKIWLFGIFFKHFGIYLVPR
jgi:hypothetical protein